MTAKTNIRILGTFIIFFAFFSCEEDEDLLNEELPEYDFEWIREANNPVYRDPQPDINYEVASDPHVFYDETEQLWMIYTGDPEENPGSAGIKLARGKSLIDWEQHASLLFETGPSNLDVNKETAFYRRSSKGKHQIYYIGYPDGDSYESQIYLAEADHIEGPYVQMDAPIVERGSIAGKNVEVITSPSIVQYDDTLYMYFLGWDSFKNVSEVWTIEAISLDEGRSWTGFQEVDVPIGMEGQITQAPDGSFLAVATGVFEGKEAIYYATADHPSGPWKKEELPILVQREGDPFEVDEVIAPQILFEAGSQQQVLYYTGADYLKGWWVLMAKSK